jgi:ribose 1,5-bisphosphokinase
VTSACGQRTLGPGRLVLVVGASGVGKDTLISHARSALSADDRYVFPRRVITRPPDASEDHHAVTATEFDRLALAGAFSLSWAAHGLRYGLPRTLEVDIAAGRVVVCNVSRTMIEVAQEKFARVAIIEITVPTAARSERLARRQRETGELMAQRLARTVVVARISTSHLRIDNSGAIAASVAVFISALLSLE